uniref:DH domain-containing protein n=1 Tax=Strigamia maritima TaxID=126957 RepID=T1JN86_STRMM
MKECDDLMGTRFLSNTPGSSLELVPILLDMYDNLVTKNSDEHDEQLANSTRNALSGCFNGLNRSRKNNTSTNASNNVDEQLQLIQYEASPQRAKPRCRPPPIHGPGGQVDRGEGGRADQGFKTSLDSGKATDSGFIDDAQQCWGKETVVRPLSLTSTSSSASSSSSLTRNHSNKKSYLASIESLNDYSEDEECVGRFRDADGMAKGCATGLPTNANAGGSAAVGGRVNKMYCDPSLSYIDRVVLEIVDSERTYVKDINEIIEGYCLGFLSDNDRLTSL